MKIIEPMNVLAIPNVCCRLVMANEIVIIITPIAAMVR